MDISIQPGPFDSSAESLATYQCPEWFRDAKFGIWSHWGPQCVPMYGDWYARHMYVEGHDQYRHHWRVYGHPSKLGYKDLVDLWHAENFDPHGLMGFYADAGAKYFFGQAMHHDNFDNFDSAYQPFNSVNRGPKQDICKMWQEAAKAKGLPFGLSEHLSASYHWFQSSKGADKTGPYAGISYDGADPANWGVYHPEIDRDLSESEFFTHLWFTENEWYHQMWFRRIKDVIDKFKPDVLYTDGGVPFGEYGRSIIAHLYNTSIAQHGANEAVYNHKDASPEFARFGILDIERGLLETINPQPWQTDTSVGDWFYNVRDKYKTAKEVAESLVDIVSKNGNLMLNIPQLPDGTHDDECMYLLKQMASWTKLNGNGIYSTRPWKVSGEGPTNLASGAFHENAAEWTNEDIRFTSAKDGHTLYAFQMRPSNPGEKFIIRSLAQGTSERVHAVSLHGRSAEFAQKSEGLEVTMPEIEESVGPVAFAITIG